MSKTSNKNLITRDLFLKKAVVGAAGFYVATKSKAAMGTMPFSFWKPIPVTTNYSYNFAGSNYLTATNSCFDFLMVGNTSATYTVEAYVYMTSYGTYGSSYIFPGIISKGTVWFNFGVKNGQICFFWYNGSIEQNVLSNSTSDVPLNTWVYVTMVVSGAIIQFYVNGVYNSFYTLFDGVASGGVGTTPYIGYETIGPGLWPGYISNLRVTNNAVYSGNFTPPTTNLTAISGTQLLTCKSSTIVDNGPNAYTLTNNTSVTPSTFAPF